ncbi:hypothetical protein [Helicobacter valdiviensis]|uniref:hypothetical protein n=1 Tax=Helicobacter valdiviensis TaxID=1458358 RepID=UPI0011B4B05A|nr:hypothetical protein [Helicobacter valdiviensis]
MQTQSFKNILNEYLKYIEIDLANSLINKTKFARNVIFLNNIKNIFLNLLNHSYAESEEYQKSYQKLKDQIKEFQLKANDKIQLNEKLCINLELIQKHIVSNTQFKIKCKEFYFSSKDFSEAFMNYIDKRDFKDLLAQQDDLDDENVTEKVFVQSLLEFNNALSHLIISVSSSSEIIQNKNFNSAINHLYRATLDNYKIIIRFTIYKTNNQDIKQSFLSIREQEFLLLGQDLKDKKINFYNPNNKIYEKKNIIQAYQELYSAIDETLKKP